MPQSLSATSLLDLLLLRKLDSDRLRTGVLEPGLSHAKGYEGIVGVISPGVSAPRFKRYSGVSSIDGRMKMGEGRGRGIRSSAWVAARSNEGKTDLHRLHKSGRYYCAAQCGREGGLVEGVVSALLLWK